jgi:hypothetical protein
MGDLINSLRIELIEDVVRVLAVDTAIDDPGHTICIQRSFKYDRSGRLNASCKGGFKAVGKEVGGSDQKGFFTVFDHFPDHSQLFFF